MCSLKKLFITIILIFTPIFLWSETNFYWDLGIVSLEGKGNEQDFEGNLSLSIGNFYLGEEKTNLVFSFNPLLCNLSLAKKDSAYENLPQRDLTSLFLLNAKILWTPIITEHIWFGPYISVNYLNPFNFSELWLSSGLEFSIFLQDDLTGTLGNNYLAKLISLETGLSLCNNEKIQYYVYGKLIFNIGILFDVFGK